MVVDFDFEYSGVINDFNWIFIGGMLVIVLGLDFGMVIFFLFGLVELEVIGFCGNFMEIINISIVSMELISFFGNFMMIC